MGEVKEEGALPRPALPLLLFPLGGLWLGLFCAEHLAWNGSLTSSGIYPHPLVVIVVGLLAGIGTLVGGLRARKLARLRPLFALLAALILGLALGLSYWIFMGNQAQRVAEATGERPRDAHTLVVLEDPKQGVISESSLATLAVEGVGAVKVRVFWDAKQEPLPLGARFTARVTFKPLSETQAFLHQKGVFGSVTLKDIAAEGFAPTPLGAIYAFREHNRRLLASIDGEGSALLRGVLLGDTTELDLTEAGRAFKVTGLSHLVAVSGSHLVVIALVISSLIRRLGLRRSIEVAIITSLLVAYVFLTGLQPSAIRACVMTFIASTAGFAGRRGHAPSALAAAAVGMLVLHPPTAFSVGFWLSVYAVFGLTIFCPLVVRYLGCLLPRSGDFRPGEGSRWRRARDNLRRVLLEPLSLTITAQAATVPITAPLFATISLVSPLSNLLVTPFVTVLVGGGIGTLCILPLLGPFGAPLLGFLCAVADISILLAGWCARLPYACLPASLDLVASNVCGLLLAAAIYRLWPQATRRRCIGTIASCALVALLLFASSFLPVHPQVVMLDVGQGDAILIRDGRSSVLVDTGPSDSVLLRALARQKTSRLDAVIITHLDEDHCGALDALVGSMPVEHVFIAAGLLEAKPTHEVLRTARMLLGGDEPEELARGDTLTVGGHLNLTMLLPDRRIAGGGNEESICLELGYDADGDRDPETRMLLTGDAESPQLARLFTADANPPHPSTVPARFDILKVGHHGSSGAVTVAQLGKMECRLALISAGKNNRYGHPSTETLSVLDEAGVSVYRTDINGDITLRFERGKVFVRCDTMTVESS